MSESLKGKVAVITGAGSGFAKATAELFSKQDKVSLVLIDLNEQALKATAAVCESAGSKVAAFQGDVTRPETFQRALKECMDKFGKVDFLINYAGGALKVAPIEEMDDAINRRILDLNLTSTIMSCRTFAPQFKKQGFGKIINAGRCTPPQRPESTPSRSASTRSCAPTASR
jgi:3-oxoacyl-[acyl-carrier protein] reductase